MSEAQGTYLPDSVNSNVAELKKAGTSVWLDDLSRDRLTSGNLAELITQAGIVGVTTNPAIFAAAMTTGTAYDDQLAKLGAAGRSASEAAFDMAIDDVQAACDAFTDIYERSGGVDGRVSIEVDPRFADDPQATVDQAKQLWERVDRPNLLIKIPATKPCLPAITETLAAGISVNVTLIFSVDCYREVIAAFITGIAQAAEAGRDISAIHSVASFFVSRVDTAVDKQLEAKGTDAALALRGRAGIANAQLAYAAFTQAFGPGTGESPANAQWADLASRGANVQRPLWASTGVKNPAYAPTLYVTELAGPDTVNTMPEGTLNALMEQGGVHGDALAGTEKGAQDYFAALAAEGLDFPAILAELETDGVRKFVDSWNELLESIDSRLS